MSKVFNALSAYYDLIYQDKDYVGEADYVTKLIHSYRPDFKRMLEFGSGTGKHAALFCAHGFHVQGVEPSLEMLSIAKNLEHKNLSFQQDSLESYSSDERFDVAIALFHVVSYINGNEELLSSFRNVNHHLDVGGLFIFDVWYSAAVLTQVPEKRTKVIENSQYKVTRLANPVVHWNKNLVDVVYDIEVVEKINEIRHQFTETHHMRHFSIPEIELLAMSSGFELLKAEEFLSSAIPGSDTWGVNFILKKK